jgi:hypothetical protein
MSSVRRVDATRSPYGRHEDVLSAPRAGDRCVSPGHARWEDKEHHVVGTQILTAPAHAISAASTGPNHGRPRDVHL